MVQFYSKNHTRFSDAESQKYLLFKVLPNGVYWLNQCSKVPNVLVNLAYTKRVWYRLGQPRLPLSIPVKLAKNRHQTVKNQQVDYVALLLMIYNNMVGVVLYLLLTLVGT